MYMYGTDNNISFLIIAETYFKSSKSFPLSFTVFVFGGKHAHVIQYSINIWCN